MNCPTCGNITYVKDSRRIDSGRNMHRRRACKKCGNKFRTLEFRVPSNVHNALTLRRMEMAALIPTNNGLVSVDKMLELLGAATACDGWCDDA